MDKKLEDTLLSIERAHEEAGKRIAALRWSLELKEFCPTAFDKGTCSTRVRGYSFRKPQNASFIITQGDETEIVFPLLDVPCHLWPEALVKAFNADYFNSRRKQLQLAIEGKTVLLTVRTREAQWNK